MTLVFLFTFGIGQMWGETTNLSTSSFYQFYANEEKDASSLISAASLPSYITTTISGNQNGKLTAISNVTTPHDFSALDTNTKFWRLKTGSASITITDVANLKAVHFYGNGSGSTNRRISTSMKKVSDNSALTVANCTIPENSNSTIKEFVVTVSSATGYSASTAYTYVFTFSGDVAIWGIYVEAGSGSGGGDPEPECPETLTISGTKGYLVGQNIELTASLSAGNGSISYQWYKGSVAPANAISGATSATYSKASCVLGDAGDYYCVASKADCADAVNTEAYTVTVNPTGTINDLVPISSDYTYTASATLLSTGLYEDGKLLSIGGNTYDKSKPGIRLKASSNVQVAFKVAAGAHIAVTFKTNGDRELYIGTTSGGQDLAHSNASKIEADRAEAGIVYLSASSDLYFSVLEITYPAPSEDPVTSAVVSSDATDKDHVAKGSTVNLTCTAENATTWQWYLGDDPISGATSSTYSVTANTVGTFAYKVAASNSFNSNPIVSSAYSITVEAPAITPSGNASSAEIPITTLNLPTFASTTWHSTNVVEPYYQVNNAYVFSAFILYQSRSAQTWVNVNASGSSERTWSETGIFKGNEAYISTGKNIATTYGSSTNRIYAFRVTNATSAQALVKAGASGRTVYLEAYAVNGNTIGDIVAQAKTKDTNLGSLSIDLDKDEEYVILVSGSDGGSSDFYELAFTFPPVAATGVTLNKSSLTLPNLSASEQLTATVLPATATNKNVTWSIAPEGYATVTNGLVEAVAAGEAVVTVTTQDGGFTATCNVTVEAGLSDDATLSSLTYQLGSADPVAISLEENKYAYAVELPFGTTTVPTVAGTANDTKVKSVVTTQATALVAPNNVATVVVTAEDGSTIKTYTVTFTVEASKGLKLVWNKDVNFCSGDDKLSAAVKSDDASVSAYINKITFTNVEGSGDNGIEGGSLNVGKKAGNMFTLSAKPGYAMEAMTFAAKIQDANCEYSLNGGAWQTLTSTGQSADKCYEVFADAEVHEFRLRSTGASGVWIRNMELDIIAACTPKTIAWTTEPAVEYEVGKSGYTIAASANNGNVTYAASNAAITVAANGALTINSLTNDVDITASVAGGDGTTYCAAGASVAKEDIKTYYLVKFNAQNETDATEVKYYSGDAAIALPADPTFAGYDFQGWFDAETGGNQYTAAITPAASMTVYAQWVAQCDGATITTQPTGASYITGRIPANLVCEATAGNGGALTYEWFTCDDALKTNPVAATATPSTAVAGTFYYFCKVTEAGCDVEAFSDVVTITVADKDPVCIIKATPTSATEATVDGVYQGNAYFKGRESGKKLNSKYDYVAVQLKDGFTFLATDKVVLNQAADLGDASDITKFYVFTEVPADGKTYVTVDNAAPVKGDNWFDMPAEMAGESSLYIGRVDANCNPSVGYLAVYRVMNPVLKKMTVAGVDGTPNNLNAITIEVPYSTPATALASIAYDWVSNSDAWTAAHTPAVANEWAFGEANTVTLEDKDGDETSYTVTINKAAASSVNTLSYLEVDGVEVDVPGNGIYTIADPLPYGTQPIITDATATHAGAVAEISNTPVHYVDANNDFWYVQAVVTPEDQDPAHRGYYQVRYTNLPKMGTSLIKGALTSNTAATITGLVGGTYDLSISTQEEDGGYKVNSGNYFGLTLADGYFQNGDIIAIEVTKASTSGGSTMAVYSDNSASTEKLITNSGALGKVGMNYFVLSIPTNVDNLNTLYIARNDENNSDNKWNGYVKSFEVMRAMPSVIKSFVVEGAQGEIDQVNKTIAVEVPKSSSLAALTPIVEAYANGGATVTPTGAQNFADGAVTYTVNSAYPTEDAAVEYQVTITKSISDKIVIFDGTENNAAVHESPDATGLAWTLTGSISVESKSAPATASKAYAKAIQCGSTGSSKNIKVTVPENYQARFFVAHNSNGSTRTLYIDTEYGQSPKDGIYNVSNTSADIAEGYSATVGEGDYYVNIAGGTVNIYELAVILTPVSPKPTITTQPVSKTDFGAGNLTATVAATVTEGTLSYQWYNADGNVAVDGATGTTLTTTTEGTYYVIVTNTKAGLPSNSVKSNEAELAYRDLTIATLSALAYGDPATAITLEENKYAYNVYLPEGTTDVPALSATATQAAYGVTPVIADAAAFIDYKATSTVTVTAEDNQTQLTYTVKFHVAHSIDALVDVTENTIWDWTTITARADGSEIDVPSGNKVYGPSVTTENGLVLANYVLGGDNWDKIEGNNGAYAIRSSSMQYYQGASLHFHTTKGGIVVVDACNEGHTMKLKVENGGRVLDFGNLGSWKEYKFYVTAGDVVIYNESADGYPMRVRDITFTVKESPDYPRDVTNNIGTLCVDHNVVAGGFLGATFYQIASRNETYPDKIDFEEVMLGEELKAGEPYIFQSTTGKIELFYGETVEPQPKEVRGMHGTYSELHVDIDESNMRNILYIAQNKLWMCGNLVGSYLTMPENRAYIVMSEVPTYADYHAPQTNGAARRRVTLGMNGTNVATGLEDVQGDHVQATKVLIDGQLYILRGEKMYDAKGQLVK